MTQIILLFSAYQEMPAEEINFGMLILRMFLFLGLILILIYFVLKKLLPFLIKNAGVRNKVVKIVERIPLDPKKSLLVIEVQERTYLIGSTEGQINVLMELDRDKLDLKPPAAPTASNFDNVLKKVLTRKASGGSEN